MGVDGCEMFKDKRPFIALVAVNELCERARELRRPGVANEVERESEETVRGAGLGVNPREDFPTTSCGLSNSGPLPVPFGFVSSSVHCRCRMMDFVAHYARD